MKYLISAAILAINYPDFPFSPDQVINEIYWEKCVDFSTLNANQLKFLYNVVQNGNMQLALLNDQYQFIGWIVKDHTEFLNKYLMLI